MDRAEATFSRWKSLRRPARCYRSSPIGTFTPPRPAKLLAGMLIGQVYRLKVANLPGHEGQEVFPTIEVIDRLYPPPGQAARFPIPIELTAEELMFALDGRYVMRVIYLEDVATSPPVRDELGEQRFTDIAPV